MPAWMLSGRAFLLGGGGSVCGLVVFQEFRSYLDTWAFARAHPPSGGVRMKSTSPDRGA